MCSNGLQQNSFLSSMFYKLKDDTEVITGTARARTRELALQFVGLEPRMKRVGGKQFERQLQFRPELRVLVSEAPGGANKCPGRKQQPFHPKMRLTICFGVAGR